MDFSVPRSKPITIIHDNALNRFSTFENSTRDCSKWWAHLGNAVVEMECWLMAAGVLAGDGRGLHQTGHECAPPTDRSIVLYQQQRGAYHGPTQESCFSHARSDHQQACSARLTAHWNPDPRFQLQSFQGPDFDRLVFGIGGIPVCSWRSLRLCIEVYSYQ